MRGDGARLASAVAVVPHSSPWQRCCWTLLRCCGMSCGVHMEEKATAGTGLSETLWAARINVSRLSLVPGAGFHPQLQGGGWLILKQDLAVALGDRTWGFQTQQEGEASSWEGRPTVTPMQGQPAQGRAGALGRLRDCGLWQVARGSAQNHCDL